MRQEFDLEVINRLPLSESILQLLQWACNADTLNAMFEKHRGACYEKILTFPVLVQLIGDALLEHQGSGRKSFQHGRENEELPVTIQAAYQKLGNLPLRLSEAFLAELTDRLAEVFPQEMTNEEVPESLQEFSVIVIDGKTMKRIPKRLLPLRGRSGGILGGKALVALELATWLAVAMATHPDGEINEAKLVPDLIPQVHQRRQKVLFVGDRQFCNPAQAHSFSAREGDHFLLRYNGNTKFFRDETRPTRTGTDSRGRHYMEEWGWLGGVNNKKRRYVRRITLYRPDAEDVILVTDLLDEEIYPADDLLELYLARWGIERVFQSITEVFSLQRLIGTTPQGTIFQLSFCLLLYNMIQIVRAYVAEGARCVKGVKGTEGGEMKVNDVSTELLFDDVHRQLTAVHELLSTMQIVAALRPIKTAEQLRKRLAELLHSLWTERWRKSKHKKKSPPPKRDKKREHASAFRIIEQHRLKNKKDSAGRK